MLLDLFIYRHYGKKIEFDGVYPYQCVDLVKFWAKELRLKIPHGNAIDYAKNADGKNYVYYVNHPWSIPRRGDIIIFKTGKFGHIGIVESGNVWRVRVFEQNNPIGRGCRLSNYNYLRPKCLGWLRPLTKKVI
jgi:surface antigen